MAGGSSGFVREHGSEGDAGVVVDGDIEKLSASAASLVLRIAGDAVARFGDAGKLLDVDVQQIAGSGMFVTDDGNLGLEVLHGVQLETGENATDRGAAQAGGLRDANTGLVARGVSANCEAPRSEPGARNCSAPNAFELLVHLS
jgi:hypothetical protein